MSIDETAMVLSGQMARTSRGTFYFDQPGNWVDEDGWPLPGRLHREDGPAAIYPGLRQEWWLNGRMHRDNGPASIWTDGPRMWYRRGLIHRDDGPAMIFADGHRQWWKNGKRTK